MSKIVSTKFGRFNAVQNQDGTGKKWLFECPGCGEWLSLSSEQMEGRQHIAHYITMFDEKRPVLCTHEGPHEYAKELVVTLQARTLTRLESEPVFEQEPAPFAPSLKAFHSWYETPRELSI